MFHAQRLVAHPFDWDSQEHRPKFSWLSCQLYSSSNPSACGMICLLFQKLSTLCFQFAVVLFRRIQPSLDPKSIINKISCCKNKQEEVVVTLNYWIKLTEANIKIWFEIDDWEFQLLINNIGWSAYILLELLLFSTLLGEIICWVGTSSNSWCFSSFEFMLSISVNSITSHIVTLCALNWFFEVQMTLWYVFFDYSSKL